MFNLRRSKKVLYMTWNLKSQSLANLIISRFFAFASTGAIPFEKEFIPMAKRQRKYERHLSPKALEAIDELLNPDETRRIKFEEILDLPGGVAIRWS